LPISFFVRALIILCMAVYLQFLPLMIIFKIVALIVAFFYLYELFFSSVFVDLSESILVFNNDLFLLDFCKMNIKNCCRINLLVVRLNHRVFLLFGDVESLYGLIKKYKKQYTSGGVKNW